MTHRTYPTLARAVAANAGFPCSQSISIIFRVLESGAENDECDDEADSRPAAHHARGFTGMRVSREIAGLVASTM